MALYNNLRLLLTAGSLLTAAFANPLPKRLEDEDDDDTPLPLVIWHGKTMRALRSPIMCFLTVGWQDWAITSPPKASEALERSPKP